MQIKGWQVAVEPVVVPKTNPSPAKQLRNQTETGISFQNILEQQLAADSSIKISQHAQKRLMQKNIVLNQKDWHNIAKAVQQAENKGVKESLLIYGDLALVASIKNKTIVTALSGQEQDHHVFTNIDGAVLVKKY